eukprot:scaffold2325_cov257-Pinguiococcus_pyrenoidosus.AAC.7
MLELRHPHVLLIEHVIPDLDQRIVSSSLFVDVGSGAEQADQPAWREHDRLQLDLQQLLGELPVEMKKGRRKKRGVLLEAWQALLEILVELAADDLQKAQQHGHDAGIHSGRPPGGGKSASRRRRCGSSLASSRCRPPDAAAARTAAAAAPPLPPL